MPRRITRLPLAGMLAAIVLLSAPVAEATKLRNQNLTRLIADSQSIVAGTVTRVTDGIDAAGIPFTEVTIAVASAAKGNHPDASTYTFRQFGLLRPRIMDSGLEYLAVTPTGFARWREGESVVAFFYTPARDTGLQATAGLAQGKLSLVDGRLVNELGNLGMFDGVEIAEGLLSPEEHSMLLTPGPVDADTFMGLVQRAVAEGWVENGEMR